MWRPLRAGTPAVWKRGSRPWISPRPGRRPPARALARALLGGLLLAFTPGPLAVLLAAACAWRAAPRRARGTLAGLLAGSWALGFATGSRGGWGADLLDPVAVAGLAALSLLAAVILWGLIAWRRPERVERAEGRGPGGLVPALLAGGVAALLALAWPAPPLDRALGLARQGGPAALAAAALAGALGLSLPWLALAASGALRRRLPASPAAVHRLREALGFLAAGSALWLLYRLSHQISPEGLAFVQLALVAAALLAWLLRQPRRTAAAALLAAGLAACLLAAPWLADRSRLPAPTVPTGVPERPSTSNR